MADNDFVHKRKNHPSGERMKSDCENYTEHCNEDYVNCYECEGFESITAGVIAEEAHHEHCDEE